MKPYSECRYIKCNENCKNCMDQEKRKDLAEKIYWILIKEGQDYLASIPLGQRMFFTPEDVRTIIREHLDELQ